MANNIVKASRKDGKTQVQFGGCLDVASAASLKGELSKILRRKPPFDLDGSAVEKIDAAGLQVLLSFLAESRNRDSDFQWIAASESLKSASRLSGLGADLGLVD